MTIARKTSCRSELFFSQLCSLLIALTACGLSQIAKAQEQLQLAEAGYITAIHSDNEFVVDGYRVSMSPQTRFGLNEKETERNGPLKDAISPGAYVRVYGQTKNRTKTTTAEVILFREGQDKKLTGTSVIDKVIAAGAEPVYRADGYSIRITAATAVTYLGDLKTLADVGTNIWLKYEGQLDKTGMLVASKVRFVPLKPPKGKTLKYWEEESGLKFRPPSAAGNDETARSARGDATEEPFVDFPADDAALSRDGSIRLGLLAKVHKIPADTALQARVRSVGMSVVPGYQKQLADDNPAKIPFHFYAVDEKQFDSEFVPFDGLILIPTHVVERLKNDDQLAAVLADGVAFSLQQQRARAANDSKVLLGVFAAGEVAEAFVPGLSLITLVGGETAANKIVRELAEQRARIALGLMADAGYDPWQAPEAWRMAAAKTLPKNLDLLKYPEMSGYQLGVLNLQYGEDRAGKGVAQ